MWGIVASVLTAVAASLLTYALATGVLGRRWQLAQRLRRLGEELQAKADNGQDVLTMPFRQRVLLPALRATGQFVARLAPERVLGALEERLAAAGRPARLRAPDFLASQGAAALAVAFLFLLLARLLGAGGLHTATLVLLGAAAGAAAPLLILLRLGARRRTAATRDLPELLDLLVVCVEAGLSFDMAVLRVTDGMHSPLAADLRLALHEINLGRPRREALQDLARRSGDPDMDVLVVAINQADELGVSVGSVLRAQAETMRVRRTQRARERALKAPVKLVFPLVFCLFPALFILLLGPAFLSAMRAFRDLQ